tara:strand:+ start:907 stop:1230 length:324 start_codon:yes stop_codon:yes gene_type:complete
MKTTSKKTIYLSPDELKEAVINYLIVKNKKNLSKHLSDNGCEMGWSESGEEFVVSIGGEIKDSIRPIIVNIAKDAVKKVLNYEPENNNAKVLFFTAKELITKKIKLD